MLPISGCAGKPEPAGRKPNSVNKTAGRESAKPGSDRQNSAPTTSGQGQLSEFVSYRNNSRRVTSSLLFILGYQH